MGLIYKIPRTSFALVAGNDFITLVGNGVNSYRLVSFYIGGMGTSSAANEVAIGRPDTAGVTPGGAISRIAANPIGPTCQVAAYSTWGTQPVVVDYLERYALNANGGQMAWRYSEREMIECGGSVDYNNTLCFRCTSGSSNIVFSCTIETF
jgi:hypothetical protein